MFRLHRNRQAKSGEKFDFKFSNFKALQVPKGWDKVFVTVVSEETGKTIVRSSKASVRNGSCQWTESVSESVSISQDDSSMEFEDCNFKLVVAMGSGRSNILGEAMVNMTNYIDSKSSSAVSLLLKKCNHGTVLQVKIQCLTPITKVRNGELAHKNSSKEDSKKEGHDSDSCSDITDSQLSRSIGSSSGADLYSSLHSGEASSREPSFSASYSQLSNDSSDVYESIENNAAKNNYSDMQRQDSVSSQNSAPCLSPNSVITCSAEATTTIEELRAEARMWEKNAHKVMADLDQLKKEFSDQSQNQESLNTALSAATAERDSLRKELGQLKLLTEKSSQKHTTIEDLSFQDGESHIVNGLKDELKFQKESNANLAQQLNRSQESNIELVAVLQELEEITEKQKFEIEELLARQRTDDDIESTIQENKNLMLQLEHLKESEKNLQLQVELLERGLEETNHELQKCEVSNQRFPQDTNGENDSKLHSEEDMNLVKQIEMLKEKVQELEKDCNELTEENIDLLYKLKQANNDPVDSTGGEPLSNSFVNFGFDTKKHKHSAQNLEERPNVIENNDGSFNKKLESMKFELEVKVEELSRELSEKKMDIEKLESCILSKEDEVKNLGDLHNKLQAKYSDLEKEKNQIEDQMGVIDGESDINSKCINDLRNEVKMLSNSVDLHASANKILESKSSELECEKQELELHVSQMELERIQLSERISILESHAVGLQDEIDRLKLEIETGSADLKQMSNDVQNQCAEAQDQCEYLQRENTKLEAAAENLIEEQNLLQKSNAELKKKNFEFQESYLRLESKLKESLERSAHYFKRVDDFEDSLSLGLEDFASKERFLSLELDSIVEENIKYKEKLSMFESLYNETYLEKATEAQELEEAVLHLTMQLAATKNDLNIMQTESDEKLKALISGLSKRNQETPAANHEKLLKQLENYELLEVKLKNSVIDLETKLSVSEKERKQHEEELINLKVQLQKMAHLQKPVTELEDSKQSRVALREKLLRKGGESVVKDDSGCDIHDDDPHVSEAETISRIQLLKTQLAEALEANKKYEDQLSKLVSDKQHNKENAPISTVEDDVVAKERYESINLALEEELRDIRERYFHMSLKYAEVEHQREELVMTLRAAKNGGRRWFS